MQVGINRRVNGGINREGMCRQSILQSNAQPKRTLVSTQSAADGWQLVANLWAGALKGVGFLLSKCLNRWLQLFDLVKLATP